MYAETADEITNFFLSQGAAAGNALQTEKM
jgi:hypothetical protein